MIIILVLLLVGAGALYLWQRENIHALITALTTDSQEIADRMETVRNEHHEQIQQHVDVPLQVSPVTTEQSSDLLDGKKTPEEVKQEMGLILDENAELGNKDDIVNQCVAELYAYKADVMGYLGGLKQAAINEWNSLDKSQRTKAKKAQIGTNGLHQCYAYEAEVDAHVQEILEKYREKMRQIGEKTDPIDILWNYYCEEKEAEKSYYLDKYMD